MRLLRAIAILMLALCGAAAGQTVTITLQVTDAGGQSWNNGTWSAQLTGCATSGCNILGTSTPVPNQQQSGVLNGTGGASVTVTPVNSIAPSGTQWTFQVCPNATSPCFQNSIAPVGNVTFNDTPPAITINMASPQPIFRAYADGELFGQLAGNQYFNTTLGLQKLWNGSAWVVFNAGTLGLGDPGANGIVKRTALNTTTTAVVADIIALFSGTCNTTTFLRGDGSCQTVSATPGGSNTQIQFNNSGVFGGITNVAAGSWIASQGATTTPVFQLKPFFDTRDLYDCTFATDSTTALNNNTANGVAAFDGSQTVFPQNCHLKTSGWQIQNHMGFSLLGNSSPGEGGVFGFGVPTVSYFGAGGAGTSVIKMGNVHSSTIENITVDGCGPGSAGCSAGGLIWDKAGPGSLNNTDLKMHNINVNAGVQGTHNASFIGVSVSPTNSSNSEDFYWTHGSINCQAGNPGTDSSIGITFNGSFNTKEEIMDHVGVTNCTTGVHTGVGGISITNADYSTNGTSIVIDGNADPMVFGNITDENSGQMFKASGGGGGSFPNFFYGNHAGPGNVPFVLPNLCYWDLGTNNAVPWNMVLVGNGWDQSPNAAGYFPLCGNQNEHLTMIGNFFSNPQTNSGPLFAGNSGFVLPFRQDGVGGTFKFGTDYSWLSGGRIVMGSNFAQGGNEDIGFKFFDSKGVEVVGIGYNNSTDDNSFGGGLAIGRDTEYVGSNASILLKGVHPVYQGTITCAVNGTAGSTNYVVRVFGKDASGNRSGWTDFTGNSGICFSAQATFTSVNSLTIAWPAAVSETNGYDIVLLNPAGGGTGWLAGTTAHGTTTITITSGPGSFNYSFPNYAESAQTVIQGESLTINAATTVSNTVVSSSSITAASLSAPVITTTSGQVSGVFNCISATPVTVNANTTNDQNLMACTVPANILNSVGRTLRIHTKSLYSTPAASTATLTFKAKLCSVSGCGSGNVATLVSITSTANAGSITNNTAILDAESTTQTAGVASRSEASGDLIIDLGAAATSADTVFGDTNATTIAGSPGDIDFTAQNFLQITVAFSVGSGSNSVTERQLVVDTVN